MTVAHPSFRQRPAPADPGGDGRLRVLARDGATRARRLASPTGVAGATVESLSWAARVALYPLGIVAGPGVDEGHGYRIEHLSPGQRSLILHDLEAAGTPILLVHGLIDNRSTFVLLRRALKRRGFGTVVAMNYSILTRDVRVAAARLAQEVDALVEQTGYERIHVVGHSLGGLIARYYVQRLGGDSRVHTLVTLGTPHGGTELARLLGTPILRQLRPGSPLMQELAGPATGCRTRFVCWWSELDEAVVPARNAMLVHDDLAVTNIRLRSAGHLSLPNLPNVAAGIAGTLAMLDADGDVTTASVTPLTTRADRRNGSGVLYYE